MEKPLVYLASPYSVNTGNVEEDKKIMQHRYECALTATAFLMSRGLAVFSPIVHCHNIANTYNLPKIASFWKSYDDSFLTVSNKMVILKIDGWTASKGIRDEIETVRQLQKQGHKIAVAALSWEAVEKYEKSLKK